jgi:hypothetical protein
MGRNLTNLYISSSFQFLTQVSGSELQNGLGDKITGSLDITASLANTATSASFATSASQAVTSSFALTTISASFATNATSASFASTSTSASFASTSTSASFASVANSASFASIANSASFATSASQAITASFALNAGATVSTSSLLVTASATNNVITFTKGDASTFNVTVATGSVVSTFPFTGSAIISGSLGVTGSYSLTSGSFSGSLIDNITDIYTSTPKVEHIVTLTQAQYNAISASADPNTLYTITDAAALVTTASVSNATITYTKNDGTTFTNTVNNVVTAQTASFVATASFANNATSASYSNNSTSASYASSSTSSSFAINATSASYAVSSSQATTASFASNIANGLNITASNILVNNNLRVNGTASFAYTETVTGSAVIIGDAFIVLNTNPTSRYAGMLVVESGSSPATTASFQFDSQTNDWFYEYTGSDPTNFGVTMFGPEYATKGSPTYLTNNRLSKGNGGHHLNDSTITDNGTNVTFTTPIVATSISASTGITGSLLGTASFADNATSASFATSASQAVSSSFATTASFALNVVPTNTGSLLTTASISNATTTYTKGDGSTFNLTVNNVVNADSASLAASATSASYALTAGSALTATSASYASASTSASYALAASSALTATSASYASASTSASFAVTASFALNAGTTPTLQQVTTAGATTNVAVTINNTASADYWLVDTKPFAKLSSNTIVAGRIDGADEDFILAGRNFNGTSPAITMTDGVFVYNQTAHEFTGSAGFDGPVTVNDAVVISGSLNVSGSIGASNIIQNNTDTFTGSAKIYEIVTCTQAEYNTVSGSANAANTLYVISDSTGGGQFVSGSLTGNVNALTITSQTASLNCSAANFFTLTLVSGSTTHVSASNLSAGQTINLRVTQASSATGSISFTPNIKQVSGSAYVPTAVTSSVDIVTFIAFDTSSLYLSNIKNFI